MAHAAAQVGRDPALGADAHDVQRRRVPLPPGLRLLLPDGHRAGRRDGRPAARCRRRQEVRRLRAAPRPAARGLGRRAGRARTRRCAAYGADAAFPLADFDSKMSDVRPDRLQGERLPRGVRRRSYSPTATTRSGPRSSARSTRRCARATTARRRSSTRAAIIHEMRLVKDEEELRSCAVRREMSAQGHMRAMQAAGPGQVRVRGPAGPRRLLLRQRRAPDGLSLDRRLRAPTPCILHYEQSNRQMKDGEVLLNDSGAEYGYYATDITRTYPVNGHFSTEQRAIYDIVLAAQKAAMARRQARRGARRGREGRGADLHRGLVKLGLLTGDSGRDRQVARPARASPSTACRTGWASTCTTRARTARPGARTLPLEPGMVFTSSPASTSRRTCRASTRSGGTSACGSRTRSSSRRTDRTACRAARRGKSPTWRRRSSPGGRRSDVAVSDAARGRGQRPRPCGTRPGSRARSLRRPGCRPGRARGPDRDCGSAR